MVIVNFFITSLLGGELPSSAGGLRAGTGGVFSLGPGGAECSTRCCGRRGGRDESQVAQQPRDATEGSGSSRARPLYKENVGKCTLGSLLGVVLSVSLRQRMAEVSARLHTVHPNPGPQIRRGRRGRGEGRNERRLRNIRRRESRNRRRVERENRNRREGGFRQIITWNLQRLSLRENNRNRLRRVLGYIEEKGWEIILITELSAEGEGIIWLGEEDRQVAVVHSKRVGIILRGEALRLWIGEGQKRWFEERVVAVVLGGFRLVSVYQPVWDSGREGMEEYRREIESQVAIGGKEILVIGGDHNANIGRNSERDGVCGKYGIGRINEAGIDLVNWCEEHRLAIANSYFRQVRRGTWFSMIWGRWYELDGFIVRSRDRHRLVRSIRTIEEGTFSDHKPKSMIVRVRKRKWRVDRREGRVPRVRWEVLRDEEKREEFKDRTREKIEEVQWEEGEQPSETEWGKIGGIMMEAAKEVCGEVGRAPGNPWAIGREEEIRAYRNRIQGAVDRRNEVAVRHRARGRLRARVDDRMMGELERELGEARGEVREARRGQRLFLRRIEREWWEERVRECEEAASLGKVGEMYRILRQIGVGKSKKAGGSSNIAIGDFKDFFEGVTKDRYEVEPGLLEEVVGRARDLREDGEAIEANEVLNEELAEEEVEEAIKEMRDSAPGEDGVRIGYIRAACREVKEKVVEMVRFMFRNRADRWEEGLKGGIIVPLFKKGNRQEVSNYRGVCLLAMGSRILARVLAKRLRWWAERLGLMDDNQAGFRRDRSTADAAQIVIRIQEDVEDYYRRLEGVRDGEQGEQLEPVAKLLDLRKAYPRVNKPALWKLLGRYGLRGRCLDTIRDLHEATEYKVRGKEGFSEGWMPARGLREGCSTSPILFNIYHQAVMRQAETERREGREEIGIAFRWIPGGSFAGGKSWERGCSEAKRTMVSTILFADDTTIVGEKREIEEGVRRVKEVMGRWEEANNEEKEEDLEFGREGAEGIRMLGSWVGAREDIRNRIRRASGLWAKVRGQLKGSRLSKRWQGRIVEACVEAGLLFDCQVRTWQVRDFKKLQSWVDRCYRYVWGNRNGQPLRQMQDRGENMWDVRERLGVRSIRSKIERRVLERIGHVMRMGNGRQTKAVVLGWFEGLEGLDKMPGKKRKTVLYWKGILREAGIDWVDIERLTGDRKGWREMVKNRMGHIDRWESQRGHLYRWGTGEEELSRNSVRPRVDLVCRYDGCGKVCKSKGGLTLHQKRIHRAPEDRVGFSCDRCGVGLETEGARQNHRRTCRGGEVGEGNRRECGICQVWVSRKNYARHVRGCGGIARAAAPGKVKQCTWCRRTLSAANMARHERRCRVWDPGGEPNP